MIHVDEIKSFIGEDRTLFSKRNKKTHIPLEDEIEKVVNKRCRTYGTGSRIEYLIRYKNSSEDNDMWVPKHYLDEVPQLIKEFDDKLSSEGVRNEDNFKIHNKRLQTIA
ncbi:chromo domain-containing protein [Dictyostelium discoideum AX4]|uniref:Chromo domain-containing protein n=1 Tax=Dictyostelium discoideum TaxID=44689 RepID=Q54AP9_DICDI|nr:chromo domain-containing protein [Dictyostelium discoideum AX4]EAL60338.2 chromo domain-containing protein [Dictyostelium discoideum AX4]|eukprot:XP_628751.2 chromo domain-containing protein [Dictyostelium discoideum AX4]